jgi:3-dehydroquinate synthase
MPQQDPEGPVARGHTTVYDQRFTVAYHYPVVFTEGLFRPANPALLDAVRRLEPDRRHRILAFLDDGLLAVRPQLPREIAAYARAHARHLELVAPPFPVPGGERIKNELFFVEHMQAKLHEHHIDRQSFVLAVGGGAVLDAVGLVAATTHRGVRLLRVPTTVLAQNDSGVGVKNGVNLFGAKNFVGTFAPPFAVLNDLDFVDLLPPREKIAGMAEAVKVALIRDAAFFAWLERHADALALFERPAMATMIRRCAELHMRQIAKGGDPFETGSARPLDFGHWSAHRLEAMTRHHLRHGEAVAIGIALDARYSVTAGLLEAGAEERICALLEHLGFRLWHPALSARDTSGRLLILQGLSEFREHLGGELTVTLLEAIGRGVEVHEMDEARIVEAIAWLESRQKT